MKRSRYFTWLVIVFNSDGRPCAWGLSPFAKKATAEAERQWKARHSRYDVRGRVEAHKLPLDGAAK